MLTVTNNTIWCSLSSSEVIHILNKDDLEQNEFVISEFILVWLTNREGVSRTSVINSSSIDSRLYLPKNVSQNRNSAKQVICCIRPEGLSLFYNYHVLLPWLSKIGVACPAIENQDYDGINSDDEIVSEQALFIKTRDIKHRRVIGHSFTTLIPPLVIDMVPGEHVIEEPCLYCGDEDYDDFEEDTDRSSSVVKITFKVDPDNVTQPLIVSGQCNTRDGRVSFYKHIVEHCVVDPVSSLNVSEEFVSLYCTNHATLKEHLRKLKELNGDDIKIAIFYSLE